MLDSCRSFPSRASLSIPQHSTDRALHTSLSLSFLLHTNTDRPPLTTHQPASLSPFAPSLALLLKTSLLSTPVSQPPPSLAQLRALTAPPCNPRRAPPRPRSHSSRTPHTLLPRQPSRLRAIIRSAPPSQRTVDCFSLFEVCHFSSPWTLVVGTLCWLGCGSLLDILLLQLFCGVGVGDFGALLDF